MSSASTSQAPGSNPATDGQAAATNSALNRQMGRVNVGDTPMTAKERREALLARADSIASAAASRRSRTNITGIDVASRITTRCIGFKAHRSNGRVEGNCSAVVKNGRQSAYLCGHCHRRLGDSLSASRDAMATIAAFHAWVMKVYRDQKVKNKLTKISIGRLRFAKRLVSALTTCPAGSGTRASDEMEMLEQFAEAEEAADGETTDAEYDA